MKVLIFVIVFLFSSLAHANTRDGLVHWYKLDETTGTTAVDSVWSGSLNGTWTNTPTSRTNCARNNCLNFSSASSQYVEISGLTSHALFLDASFTVSAWVKTSTATFQIVVAKENVTGFDFSMDCASSGTGFTCARGKGSAGANSIERRGLINIADGNWHLMTASYTLSSSGSGGQDIQMYTDGVLDQGSVTNSIATVTISDPLAIGRRATGTYFNGQIDDVRIYNRILTAQEVKDLYNAGIREGYAPGT